MAQKEQQHHQLTIPEGGLDSLDMMSRLSNAWLEVDSFLRQGEVGYLQTMCLGEGVPGRVVFTIGQKEAGSYPHLLALDVVRGTAAVSLGDSRLGLSSDVLKPPHITDTIITSEEKIVAAMMMTVLLQWCASKYPETNRRHYLAVRLAAEGDGYGWPKLAASKEWRAFEKAMLDNDAPKLQVPVAEGGSMDMVISPDSHWLLLKEAPAGYQATFFSGEGVIKAVRQDDQLQFETKRGELHQTEVVVLDDTIAGVVGSDSWPRYWAHNMPDYRRSLLIAVKPDYVNFLKDFEV